MSEGGGSILLESINPALRISCGVLGVWDRLGSRDLRAATAKVCALQVPLAQAVRCSETDQASLFGGAAPLRHERRIAVDIGKSRSRQLMSGADTVRGALDNGADPNRERSNRGHRGLGQCWWD